MSPTSSTGFLSVFPARVPVFARRPVLLAAAAQLALLLATSGGYGYHRDELYFRMLDPAWGYVDQPPFTPMVARLMGVIADQAWALRVPAALAAAAGVVVMGLLVRELGGGRRAQAFGAWGYAFAAAPLLFGHVLLTSTFDLLVWPAVLLLIARGQLRADPRAWVWAGLVVGVASYNRLLVALLVVAVALGLLVTGPRALLLARPLVDAAVIALVVALPNVVYQATHGWPQLSMGRALSEANAADVRVGMWPLLALLLGPPLLPVWLAGWWALARWPALRPVRFLAVAFPVVLLFTFVTGAQPHYPVGLLAVLFAAGCAAGQALLQRPGGRAVAATVIAMNAVVSAVIALPLVPADRLGDTPIPDLNQLARDSVGWPTYVAQVASVYRGLPDAERSVAVVVTSNYGEAGAIDRYGAALGLPAAYSGHNELGLRPPPPEAARTVILVGAMPGLDAWFASCEVRARLDNGLGVDNEEQGQPVSVCREPRLPWAELWPRFRHLD